MCGGVFLSFFVADVFDVFVLGKCCILFICVSFASIFSGIIASPAVSQALFWTSDVLVIINMCVALVFVNISIAEAGCFQCTLSAFSLGFQASV